jgi:GTP cyclohydrolase II
MTLGPSIVERLARARADLRMGVPVVLTADGRGALVVAVETLSAERLAGLRALGVPELAITAWRAETLKARAYDNDLARLCVPDGVDLAWLRAIADPADDLNAPMKGPLRSLRDGRPICTARPFNWRNRRSFCPPPWCCRCPMRLRWRQRGT